MWYEQDISTNHCFNVGQMSEKSRLNLDELLGVEVKKNIYKRKQDCTCIFLCMKNGKNFPIYACDYSDVQPAYKVLNNFYKQIDSNKKVIYASDLYTKFNQPIE